MLSGAANALNHIISLGGQGAFCGVIGHDEMGRLVVHLDRESKGGLNGASERFILDYVRGHKGFPFGY